MNISIENRGALRAFVEESNMIEGIYGNPSNSDINWFEKIVCTSGPVPLAMMEDFVFDMTQAKLRNQSGMNVMVGNHMPPAGGMNIVYSLHEVLDNVEVSNDVFRTHIQYEHLHPFTDGNGRSGRALWLRMMFRVYGERHTFSRSFLHHFYYQSLAHFN